MHPATNSVQCTFPSAKPETDVVCVCGSYGLKLGTRQWVQFEVEAIQSWPTMALKSRSQFKSCAARGKDLKGKGKVRVNLMWWPYTAQWILTYLPFLWFMLRRRRTLLPHFKVQVM